jgi:hypothetical protein
MKATKALKAKSRCILALVLQSVLKLEALQLEDGRTLVIITSG